MASSRLFSFDHARGEEQLEALAVPLELTPESGEAKVFGGRYRGVPLRLDLDGHTARLRMRIDGRLPPGLWIRSRRHSPPQDLERPLHFGEAPLDEALVAESDHPAAALRLLREADVQASLVAVFSGRAATLDDGELTVRVPELSVDAIRPVLSAAATLVVALGAAARTLEQSRLEAVARTRQAGTPDLQGRRFVARELPGHLEEQRIIREWASRRRKVLLQVVPLSGVAVFLAWPAFSNPLLGLADECFLFTMLAMFSVMIGRNALQRLYRCPRCDSPPFGQGNFRIRPRRCEGCNARLR